MYRFPMYFEADLKIFLVNQKVVELLNDLLVGLEGWSHVGTSLDNGITQEQTFYSKTSSDGLPPNAFRLLPILIL